MKLTAWVYWIRYPVGGWVSDTTTTEAEAREKIAQAENDNKLAIGPVKVTSPLPKL